MASKRKKKSSKKNAAPACRDAGKALQQCRTRTKKKAAKKPAAKRSAAKRSTRSRGRPTTAAGEFEAKRWPERPPKLPRYRPPDGVEPEPDPTFMVNPDDLNDYERAALERLPSWLKPAAAAYGIDPKAKDALAQLHGAGGVEFSRGRWALTPAGEEIMEEAKEKPRRRANTREADELAQLSLELFRIRNS